MTPARLVSHVYRQVNRHGYRPPQGAPSGWSAGWSSLMPGPSPPPPLGAEQELVGWQPLPDCANPPVKYWYETKTRTNPRMVPTLQTFIFSNRVILTYLLRRV